MKKILTGMAITLSIACPINAMNQKNMQTLGMFAMAMDQKNMPTLNMLTVNAQLKDQSHIIFDKATEYVLYAKGCKLNGWESLREGSCFIDTEVKQINLNIVSIEYRVRKGDLSDSVALTGQTLRFPMLYNQCIAQTVSIEIDEVPHSLTISVLKEKDSSPLN